MNKNDLLNCIDLSIKAAIEAGEEILKIYDSTFEVAYKEDQSPLTQADKNAHLAIVKYLNQTTIPVLSEEGRSIDYQERKDWGLLWIVDPLDGTKEFVKKNGEFTVNIALIENGTPIMGVIYIPVNGVLYSGAQGIGAFKQEGRKRTQLPIETKNKKYTAVGSRSHNSPETELFFDALRKQHGDIEIVSMGSSLKICLVAEGVADVYPRFAPTMEWDTAAGHAIAKYAGKTLKDVKTGKEMVYNRPNLLNNHFIVE